MSYLLLIYNKKEIRRPFPLIQYINIDTCLLDSQ